VYYKLQGCRVGPAQYSHPRCCVTGLMRPTVSACWASALLLGPRSYIDMFMQALCRRRPLAPLCLQLTQPSDLLWGAGGVCVLARSGIEASLCWGLLCRISAFLLYAHTW
jgi:hypothetical protein